MKKLLFVSMSLLILCGLAFAINMPRGYSQRIVSPLFELTSTYVTNTAINAVNKNYLFTATKTNSKNTLSTATDPIGVIRVKKVSKYAITFVQLSSFDTQWKAGEVVHCTLTFIGDGPYKGQTTSWDMTIPDKKGNPIQILDLSKKVLVPPFKR
jgi:hypothetical protein